MLRQKSYPPRHLFGMEKITSPPVPPGHICSKTFFTPLPSPLRYDFGMKQIYSFRVNSLLKNDSWQVNKHYYDHQLRSNKKQNIVIRNKKESELFDIKSN